MEFKVKTKTHFFEFLYQCVFLYKGFGNQLNNYGMERKIVKVVNHVKIGG
jgi:hypothetical protein